MSPGSSPKKKTLAVLVSVEGHSRSDVSCCFLFCLFLICFCFLFVCLWLLLVVNYCYRVLHSYFVMASNIY